MKRRQIPCSLTAIMVAAALMMSGCGTGNAAATSAASTANAVSEAEAASVSTSAASTVSDENTIVYPDPSLKENLPDEKPTAAEDFYLSVNYDFIKDTEIPDGAMGMTSDYEQEMISIQNMEDLLSGDSAGDENLEKVSTLYKEYLDTDSRNAAGWNSVKPYVEAIEQVATVDDFYKVVDADMTSWDLYGLFSLDIGTDEKDAGTYFTCMSTPSLSLGDVDEYTEMTDEGKSKKETNDAYYTNLLKKYGYSDDQIQTMIGDYYTWEGLIAPYMYTEEEEMQDDFADISNNPETEEELVGLAAGFPMQEVLTNMGISGQEKFIIDAPDYFQALGSLVTEENLQVLKDYTIINLLSQAAEYTDEEAYGYYNDWINASYGTSGMSEIELLAYSCVCNELSELTGKVYAEAFFDESTEEDVREILDNVRAALRARLESNTWLSEESRQIAVEKLDAIKLYIGTAAHDAYDYSKITVDPSLDLFTNIVNIKSECDMQDLSRGGSAVDTEAWGIIMPANISNGCYIAEYNCVYITAAMLEAPYYSKDYTLEQNYGGIGMAIGHEFTHAFDKNGSQYDKDGNLVNWMSDEDKEKFDELSAKVSERYGSYALVGDQHVDGQLTLGETVADLGGAASALDALKVLSADQEINYEDFFTQNATLWAQLFASDEVETSMVLTDTHAPGCLRTNVNLTQFQEFYDTFGVKEGDPMYTAPEDRLSVW